MDAVDPDERTRAIVDAIVATRRDGGAVAFEAAAEGDAKRDNRVRVVYDDRTLELTVDDAECERLDDLLADYRVFKVAQPETRKARDGVVYLSAVTDAKHAADFLESALESVYDLDGDYALWIG